MYLEKGLLRLAKRRTFLSNPSIQILLLICRKNPAAAISTLEGKNGKIGRKRFLVHGVGVLGRAITDPVRQAVEVLVHPQAREEEKNKTKIEIK